MHEFTVRVTGFSQDWSTFPVELRLKTEPLFGSLRGGLEPGLKTTIRQRLEGSSGPVEPHRCRFSEDGCELILGWNSKGNGSTYIVQIERGKPLESRFAGAGLGVGDALLAGVPGQEGPLHLGLISRPQVLTGKASTDLICTVTGFQGGMFLCRRLGDDLLYEAPRRIFLRHLMHDTVDWDNAGRTDLVCAEGRKILLVRNQGDDREPLYGKGMPLRTTSGPLEVENLAKVDVIDLDGDGPRDVICGTNDNSEYWPGGENPWQNKECGVGYGKGYDDSGRWLGGREHASILVCRNIGTQADPLFEEPKPLLAGGREVDLPGGGKIGAGDLDGDGDPDIVFGEHLDRIWYIENAGGPGWPEFRKPVPLRNVNGRVLRNPQCMGEPIVCDLDRNGVPDLVFGSEDGYVYFCRRAGGGRSPAFEDPVRLRQRNPFLGTGVMAIPSAVDWDGDGDLDLIMGCAAGYVEFHENVGTRRDPRFAESVRLKAGGETIRIQAGRHGSIQGPNEAKWGYTNPVVCDWDGDGLHDIVLSDVKGEHLFYRNVGKPGKPELERARPIYVGRKKLKTVWRTRPIAMDLDGDGLCDYACLDANGYLAIHWRRQRHGRLVLERGIHPRYEDGSRIKMDSLGGKIGRTQLCGADWDGDGDWDIVFGAHETTPMLGDLVHTSVLFLENLGSSEAPVFRRPRPILIQGKRPIDLGGHCCSPHAVDWDGDGELDLIVGAENGNIYYFHRSFLDDQGEVRTV